MGLQGDDVRGTFGETVVLMYMCVCCFPEASKLVMSYVAAVCGKGQEVNKVKEQLLQSNPVLEGE